MAELFTPEYGPNGFPRLEVADRDFMQALRNCGIAQVGYDALDVPSRLATPDDPVDAIAAELRDIAATSNQVPYAEGVGLALGQTLFKNEFGEAGYPDVFVAMVDPETGRITPGEFHPYVNFTIHGEEQDSQATIPAVDEPGIWAKHACLSTGPISPIAITASEFRYTTWAPTWQRIDGEAQGMPGAVLDHEHRHNQGLLKALGRGVLVTKCVPVGRLEMSRKLSPEEAKTQWPLGYMPEHLVKIFDPINPHRLVELQDSTYVLPRDR